MDALVGPFSLPASDTRTHFGFVVGGGIEHAFTPNFHGRLEYLYGSFNDKTYDLSVSTCGTPCFADLDFDQLHLVRASLTWNFGGLFY
jgi:outer membrane immunogenic protein